MKMRAVRPEFSFTYRRPTYLVIAALKIYTQNICSGFLGKASLRRHGTSLLRQSRLVPSQRTRFKDADGALHEFKRAALLLHSRTLIKRL